MRIGVFGGTFDPVHLGHLILAEQCREQGHLDELWFIPAAAPPHKLGQSVTPFTQRVEMLALAVAGNPCFRVEEIEKERPGPSYTADTLAEIQQRLPEAELFLLLGSDALVDLPKWYHPERIVTLARLLVLARPGIPLMMIEDLEKRLHLTAGQLRGMDVVSAPLIDISSRDLRSRAAQGSSLRYLVPRAVEVYIQEKRLYRA